uniref:Uncharacterized protein n=1 Tax=Strigamia maritima TaxID=126957 RepID=T1JHW0_STRMM
MLFYIIIDSTRSWLPNRYNTRVSYRLSNRFCISVASAVKGEDVNEMVSLLYKCITGPRLFRINQLESEESGKLYEPNVIEKCGDQVIKTLSWIYSLGFYSSPIIAVVLYRRGYFMYDGLNSIFRFVSAIGILVLAATCIRGIGRLANRDYLSFLTELDNFKRHLNFETKRPLMKFDFEFNAWPVEYSSHNSVPNVDNTNHDRSMSERIVTFPIYILSYIFAHTIGCKMVYPGSVGLLQSAMSAVLIDGRAALVRQGGVRYKLLTQERHEVETMFVDHRSKPTYPKGNKLVICSEGNAGFYEVGIMQTVLELGYSVLGWNHPGFGGSTGVPYPNQEREAIDCVMQFAINKLGFQPSDIILFAWSIGGYTASYAAMSYPDVHAVVLDATFDDLEPLAVAKMPPVLASIVSRTVKDHMNLNIAEQICQYPGRVLFIRRTDDEMISTDNPPSMRSNRGNNLLYIFLKCRYPEMVNGGADEALRAWLMSDRVQRSALAIKFDVRDDVCTAILHEYFSGNGRNFPSTLGKNLSNETKTQLIIFLASKHFIDFNSTHCTQLPKQLFNIPWSAAD